MRKIILVCFAVVFASCNRNDVIADQGSEPIEDKLDISDITGVWTLDSNPLYYISLSEGGRFSYCFSENLMGSGNYILDGNQITLNNGYTYLSDKLELSLNNNSMSIKGPVQILYQSGNKNINLTFQKSNESISPSIIGVERKPGMPGLNKFYDDIRIVVTYVSDYTATYEYSGVSKSTGKRKTLKSYAWYYAYRKPYTYTQQIEGDGKVVIYNFDEISPSGSLDVNVVPQN